LENNKEIQKIQKFQSLFQHLHSLKKLCSISGNYLVFDVSWDELAIEQELRSNTIEEIMFISINLSSFSLQLFSFSNKLVSFLSFFLLSLSVSIFSLFCLMASKGFI
jgi:hypothetical protein